MSSTIDTLIETLAAGLDSGDPLRAMAEKPDEALLAVQAKQVEIGKWQAEDSRRPLIAALLVRRALAGSCEDGAGLKRINAAAKAVEATGLPELLPFVAAGGPLDTKARTFAGAMAEGGEGEPAVPPAPATLPLTVLFHEGPIARAYLATMAAHGLRPARIVSLVSSSDLATRKPIGGWVPSPWKRRYRQWHQRQQIHHWPRLTATRHPELLAACSAAVEPMGFARATLEEARALVPLDRYTDDLQFITIASLRDGALRSGLEALSPQTLLFTGGGLVPRALIEIPGIRFLHVHPGKLPQLRGADCSLWSTLIHGRPSASAFWMAPGIDEGCLLHSAWLPALPFDLGGAGHELKTLYRAFYSFVDPWIRARVLLDLLSRNHGLPDVEGEPQDLSAGETYHFMHRLLQQLAFERMGLAEAPRPSE